MCLRISLEIRICDIFVESRKYVRKLCKLLCLTDKLVDVLLMDHLYSKTYCPHVNTNCINDKQ